MASINFAFRILARAALSWFMLATRQQYQSYQETDAKSSPNSAKNDEMREVHPHGTGSGALAFVRLYVWLVLVKVVRN
jgi:hypothetical protein